MEVAFEKGIGTFGLALTNVRASERSAEEVVDSQVLGSTSDWGTRASGPFKRGIVGLGGYIG